MDHTGDMALLARAPTLRSLYDALTRGLFEVILDTRTVEAREKETVSIQDAVDAEDLLVRYLSELLFLHDARDWLFRGAEVVHLSEKRLAARALGERFDPERHTIDRQIKAVTYHHLLLSQDGDGWTARCVLDL
jgi:SHS2 domain-containing protein